MKSSSERLVFKVVDVNEPTKVYGELVLEMGSSRKREWSFKLSEDISLDSWKAFGLFAGQGNDDSPYLEDVIINRVPLRDRMRKDLSHNADLLLDIIKSSGLRVVSDSFKLIPA